MVRFLAQLALLAFGVAGLSTLAQGGTVEPPGIPASLRASLDRTIGSVASRTIDSADELRLIKRKLLDQQSALVARFQLPRDQAMGLLADEGLRMLRALRARWPQLYDEMTTSGMVGAEIPEAGAQEIIHRLRESSDD